MEMLPYVDGLIKEYFLFRGFSNAYNAFEAESDSDKAKAFNVEEIAALILDTLVPKFQCKRLISLCEFLKSSIFSKLEPELQDAFDSLARSIYKRYIVNALEQQKTERVAEFFQEAVDVLRQQQGEWSAWFSIHYLSNPELEPEFEIYFSKEWCNDLRVSLQNLFSSAFHKVPLPSILRFNLDRVYRRNLQLQVKALEVERTRLEALLSLQNRSEVDFESNESTLADLGAKPEDEEGVGASELENRKADIHLEDLPGELIKAIAVDVTSKGEVMEDTQASSSNHRTESQLSCSSSISGEANGGEDKRGSIGSADGSQASSTVAAGKEGRPAGPEVILSLEFAGHEAPITSCRFSPDGENVASSSDDGTVRIWSPQSAWNSSTRNATIRNAMSVLSLDWERRKHKLLFLGTDQGTVKAWSVDSKRFVFDLNVHKTLMNITSVKCCPSEGLLAVLASPAQSPGPLPPPSVSPLSSLSSSASSSPPPTSGRDAEDDATGQLSVWNIKSWTRVGNLSASKDGRYDSRMNCIAFSKNGRILAAGSEDGMVHLFDVSSRNVIAGFPAYSSPIVDIQFGCDEKYVWTLGKEGQVVEWELATAAPQREVNLWECLQEVQGNDVKEMTLDHKSLFLAVTFGSSVALLDLTSRALRPICIPTKLGSLASIDMHPFLDIFVTGSKDNTLQTGSITPL